MPLKGFKKNLIAGTIIALLGATTAGSYLLYRKEMAKNTQLEKQLQELSEREKKSVIVQRISTQMEEIAREQKEISDEQRREAEEQTIVANEMRRRAEVERQNAQEAEATAQASERKAVEASKVAERQRTLAEQRQQQAEYSRSVADTLSYLALARSLGAQAVTQQNTGNKELAALLAYASYIYTSRYGGDVYQPAIYEALSLTSKSSRKWAVGKGAIMKMLWLPGSNNRFMTVSTYGELVSHEYTNGKLRSTKIIENSNYDFRDLYISSEGKYYAISHTGHLVAGKGQEKTIKLIPGAQHPFRLYEAGKDRLIVTAEQSIHIIDLRTLETIDSKVLPFKATIAGEENDEIILFDNNGKMHYYTYDLRPLRTGDTPSHKNVYSFTYNISAKLQAYGMNDGDIYLVNSKGKSHRLIGHRSKVSRVRFEGNRLFSTSFDGRVLFWNINSDKIEPMSVLKTDKWVVSSSFDNTRNYLWTGDQNGNLMETLISVPLMAEKLKSALKRDFTQEEWAYYMGSNIPFESFKK